MADSWVHEGFANYAESLFEECQQGKESGEKYVIGTRSNIRNDRPIIASYGVNQEGSGDVYYKGGNMLHLIRQLIGDDEKWRAILRGVNATFRHQTVTGAQIQGYLSEHSGIDLRRVFAQYLSTTKVPVLEYDIAGDSLTYQWKNVIPGFDMRVRVRLADSTFAFIRPTETSQKMPLHLRDPAEFTVDRNFYVIAHRAGTSPDTTVRGQTR